MKKILDIRYPGIRYQGEVTFLDEDTIEIESDALRKALLSGMVPVGAGSKGKANVEISSFSIDDDGRIVLISSDFKILKEKNTMPKINLFADNRGISKLASDYDLYSSEGYVNNTAANKNCPGLYNYYCSEVTNYTCNDMTNDACS